MTKEGEYLCKALHTNPYVTGYGINTCLSGPLFTHHDTTVFIHLMSSMSTITAGIVEYFNAVL